jgi:autotransporter-associated beta strand protein
LLGFVENCAAFAAILVLVAAVAAVPRANAQDITWSGANNTWTSTAAWSGGVVPTSANGTIFNTNNVGFLAPVTTGAATVPGIRFESGAGNYTFTGSRLTLSGNLTNSATGTTQTINGGFTNSANNTYSTMAGSSIVVGSSGITISSSNATSRTLTIAGAGNFTTSSIFDSPNATGSYASIGTVNVTSTGTTSFGGSDFFRGLLTMNGTGGVLTLSGNRSRSTGGITLINGTLNINNKDALGNGTLTLGAGTFNNTSGAPITNLGNNTVSLGSTNAYTFGTNNSTSLSNLDLGTGNVTFTSDRNIPFAGNGTTLTVGRLTPASVADALNARNATGGVNNTLVVRGLSLSGNATITTPFELRGNVSVTINGEVNNGAGPGGFWITNTAGVTLNANSTYTGNTTISGLLRLNAVNSIPGGIATTGGTSPIVFNTGGILGLTAASGDFTRSVGNGTDQYLANTNNSAGFAAYGGNRSVNISGNGTAIILGSFSQSGTGLTLCALNSDSTIMVVNSVEFSNASRTLTVNDGTAIVDAIISGDLTGIGSAARFVKAGSGTLVLTGTNTVGVSNPGTGTLISDGIVQIGDGGTSGTLSGNVGNNASLVFNRSDALTISGYISGNGTVKQVGAGTTTLSGNNTYTGNTSVSAGTLALTGSQASALALADGTKLQLDVAYPVTSTASLSFAGNASISVVGTPAPATTYNLISALSISGAPALSTPVPGFSLTNTGTVLQLVPDVSADTTKPIIVLNGNTTLTVNAGSTYIELGAVATDETAPTDRLVIITGTVNTAVPGVYVLSYDAADAVGNAAITVTRTVTVADVTAPAITLTGSSSVSVNWGATYTETGAIAADEFAPANPAVIISGSVNTAKPGTYTLNYNAQDTAGNNAAQVQRTVTVAIANPTDIGADGLSPLMKYALGANSPSDTVQAPVVSAAANTLVLTAVVRTDDPKLSVVGTTKTDLTSGTWATTGVSGSPAGSGTVGDQTGVITGQRKVYTVTTGSKTFLRLEATLAP